MNAKNYSLLSFLLFICSFSKAQTITTGVQDLGFHTNAQSMGSGWVGVVASDLNTQNGFDQNPSLLARNKDVMGFQLLNYVRWIPDLADGIRFYETGYYQTFGKHAIGFSARYNTLGNLLFTDIVGNVTGTFRPYEFFTQLNYAIRLSENFSLGVGIKYIYSDLTGGFNVQNVKTYPATAFAGDFGLDYRRDIVQTESYKLKWNAGLSVLNLGNKVSYAQTVQRDFLPQTFKLGNMLTFKMKTTNDDYVAVDFSYQANKLLVPTPPIYAIGNSGQFIPDGSGGFVIAEGYDPNVSAMRGVFQSFYDAPGGFKEEMREIIHQFGTEARISLFDNKFLLALRSGHFNEHVTKGNRKFVTVGVGLGVYGFRIDFAKPVSIGSTPNLGAFVSLGARFNIGEGGFFRFIEH